LYYSPDRLLFDCGEGVSSYLGNKCFAVQRVFLSHGHTDHIAGLLSLVNIRNSAMGDTKKDLMLYYPAGNQQVGLLKSYLDQAQRRLSYPLRWIPVKAGERIEVFSGQLCRYVVPFPTQHGKAPSLGYNVVEERRRLKPEFQGKAESELRQLAQTQRTPLSEVYPQKLFSYGGDSVPLDPECVAGTEILCHEATFLIDADREGFKHSTLKEAVQVAHAAGVKRELIVIHVSSRYKHQLQAAKEEVAAWNLPFEVTIVHPGRVFRRS